MPFASRTDQVACSTALCSDILRNWTEYWHMPLGILLLLVVFFAPKGLAGLVRVRSAADPATAAKEQA